VSGRGFDRGDRPSGRVGTLRVVAAGRSQARADAWTFGISQRFEAYLEQFAPEERMQHILAMFAALENQFELCQRLLCIESEANRHDPKNTEPIGKFIEIDLFREAATL